MISQAELERAIARWKVRQSGGQVDAESYPADVEVGYEGAPTPVPPPAWGGAGLPREAYRSDSELAALGRPPADGDGVPIGYGRGAAVPRGNDEPTVVAEEGGDYALLDSGVVELSDPEEER